MNAHNDNAIDFSSLVGKLASDEVWEYESASREACRDVAGNAYEALQRPIDFPALEAAIVAGDHVALAVDPNVPQLAEVLRGVIQAIQQTDAGEIDIVLGDEVCDALLVQITDDSIDAARVVRHDPSHREGLRYLGADELADPIYLNRRLVDADFVLPIVAGRPLDTSCIHDLTGVFPMMADAASRIRFHQQTSVSLENEQESKNDATANPQVPSWLLGIQVMVCVTANDFGSAGQIIAGTPDAVRKQLTPSRRMPDEFPPPAPLVIASMDGDAQQQTWANAARALSAAVRYVEPKGTIVLWSAIDETPTRELLRVSDSSAPPSHALEVPIEGEFPAWDESVNPAITIARVATEHRLLIHSRVRSETIESMGLGSVDHIEHLENLSREFNSCGVLRAAPFAGTTTDSPVQQR